MTERFTVGDRVRVKEERIGGNPRTPGYVKGRLGTITEQHGVIINTLDHHHPYPPLYSVVFRVEELGGPSGPDLVVADIHDEWLDLA